jgi:hypothetical protein
MADQRLLGLGNRGSDQRRATVPTELRVDRILGSTLRTTEARRRKYPDESVTEWVIREGFEWAIETLQAWMSELRTLANGLENPAIVQHLDGRAAVFAERRDVSLEGLRNLAKLRDALNRNP